jgi:outer membrane immunogenic protein
MAKLQTSVIALAVAAGGLLGLSATASADGYVRGPAPVAGCCSWSGMYFGINGGYGWSATDNDVVVFETVQAQGVINPSGVGVFGSTSPSGGFGGLTVGYNFKGCCGPWVAGIEADFEGSGISDKSTGFVPNYLPGGLNATVDTNLQLTAFGTLRGRLGYSVGPTLLYATGGLAWGEVTHTMRFVDNFGFTAQDRSSDSRTGYVVGAGAEYMMSCCWSLKLEYQYINLGSEGWSAPLLFTAGGGAATVFRENQAKVDLDFHTVRVGLNYKFNDNRDAPLK